jgi:hypothetical protein
MRINRAPMEFSPEHGVECTMSVAQYDARDVLDSYLRALNTLDQSSVCNAAELSYPKDLIKFVLPHRIKTIEEEDKRTFLRNA